MPQQQQPPWPVVAKELVVVIGEVQPAVKPLLHSSGMPVRPPPSLAL